MKIIVISILLSLLAACTTVPVAKSPASADPAMSRAAVVTIGSLKLDPKKPSTLSWSAPIDVIGSEDVAQVSQLKQYTQAAIQNQIERKGYPLLVSGGDYQMKATLVLAKNAAQSGSAQSQIQRDELLKKSGIDPGLAGGSTQGMAQGKGSLVLELKQGRALRWRGAVQIYLLDEFNADIAAQRIEHAVAQLLLIWP